MYKITNLPVLETELLDNIYSSNNKQKILTTEKNGTLRISNQNNELIKEIKNHKGPIMDLCFASITLPPYIITVGYDRRINLYNLDEIEDKPLFSYEEDNLEYGFFNHVCFLKSSKGSLNFAVTTSNGYIYLFSSENNFQPDKKQIYNSSISSINCLNIGAIVMTCKEEKARLYFDNHFSGFIEFSETNNKDLKTNFFVTQNQESELNEEVFIEVQDKQLTLWYYNDDEKLLKQIFQHDFEFNIINCVWNFGGISALVTLLNKGSSEFYFCKLKQDFQNNLLWEVQDLKKSE